MNPDELSSEDAPVIERKTFERLKLPADSKLKIGSLSGAASMRFAVSGTLTATAMTSATVYFDDIAERGDWVELPRELAKLDITHLRMLAEITEPVIPKLEMLTSWRPKVTSDATVRLAAASVLNEKLAARDRSHTRVLQWIVVGASVLSFALGKWVF